MFPSKPIAGILSQMAAKAKKLLITTEKHELFIVRTNSGVGINGFCPVCNHEVEMLTVDSVVTVTGVRTRELIARIADGEIHSIEAANGHLLVCKSSLRQGQEPERVNVSAELSP
ncbi:MAG: hypothetical protein ACRD6N_06495 [Pyrinomonadaceae bacterium]